MKVEIEWIKYKDILCDKILGYNIPPESDQYLVWDTQNDVQVAEFTEYDDDTHKWTAYDREEDEDEEIEPIYWAYLPNGPCEACVNKYFVYSPNELGK